jgi:UDP-glucose 4-epimerase
MDFVYVGDIARANMLAAASDVTDDVFNVASGVETSLLELAHALLHVMDSDLPVEHGPERSVNKVPRRLADTSRARTTLAVRRDTRLRRHRPTHLYPEPLRIALPHTEAAARDVMMLPLFPGLTDEQQDYVIERVAAHVVALAA